MSRSPGTAAPGAKSAKPAGSVEQKQFHSVEIRCGSRSCGAVLRLKSKRFLSRQSPPKLPLSDCDHPASCACKYLHHQDRRDDSRREADTGIWNARMLFQDTTRRKGNGRRQQD